MRGQILTALVAAILIAVIIAAVWYTAAKRPVVSIEPVTRTPLDYAIAAGDLTRSFLEQHPPRDNLAAAAAENYIEALRGLRGAAQRWLAPVGPRPMPALRPAWQDMTTIIDRADDFANHQDILVTINLPNHEWEQLPALDEILAATIADTRATTITARQQLAAATAAAMPTTAPAAAIATAYVNLATQHTSDDQSAHDSGVLGCLRAIVDRLRADNGGAQLPSPAEIRGQIVAMGDKLSEGRPERLRQALGTIDGLTGHNITSINATDIECLQLVWARAADPRNFAVKDNLKQAVFDSLYDAWEYGSLTCSNGRATRILSALVLLDFDERNWAVKRLEHFKNDIFSRAPGVIERVAREAAATADNDDMKLAAASYLPAGVGESSTSEPPAVAAAELADRMRSALTQMVHDYIADQPDGSIPAHMVKAVTAEVVAAVAD